MPEYCLPRAISLSTEYQLPKPLCPIFLLPIRLTSSFSERCLARCCSVPDANDGEGSTFCAGAIFEKIGQSIRKRNNFVFMARCLRRELNKHHNCVNRDSAKTDNIARLSCLMENGCANGTTRCPRTCLPPASC